jgi:hypothetical protein
MFGAVLQVAFDGLTAVEQWVVGVSIQPFLCMQLLLQ